jgi:hypothetical protein
MQKDHGGRRTGARCRRLEQVTDEHRAVETWKPHGFGQRLGMCALEDRRKGHRKASAASGDQKPSFIHFASTPQPRANDDLRQTSDESEPFKAVCCDYLMLLS